MKLAMMLLLAVASFGMMVTIDVLRVSERLTLLQVTISMIRLLGIPPAMVAPGPQEDQDLLLGQALRVVQVEASFLYRHRQAIANLIAWIP